MNKVSNVFVISTEYHFLLTMSIIEQYFSGSGFSNKLVLKGVRSGGINKNNLPKDLECITLAFEDKDFKNRVEKEILGEKIDNLFVVHAYRAYETYLIAAVPRGTRKHLIQDGALFYHHMERSLILNRARETYQIYKQLWNKGVLLKKLTYYPRHMHRSRFIDELWMTNPEVFVDPDTKLKINKVDLFPNPDSVKKFNNYFNVSEHDDYRNIEDCMIYLAPIIRDRNNLPVEIEQIKKLRQKVKKKNVIIKLHPGMKDKSQFNALQDIFGNSVIQNYIPAEMYIANSKNSCVIGSASTALFYKNPECENFALKKLYQKLGIYASWKNVSLPKYVHNIDKMEDFEKYI